LRETIYSGREVIKLSDKTILETNFADIEIKYIAYLLNKGIPIEEVINYGNREDSKNMEEGSA